MRCSAYLLLATVLYLFSAVEWIIGVPIPSNDQEESEQSHTPFQYQNESDNYEVIDDMIINKDVARAGLVDGTWPNAVVPYSFAMTIAPNQRTMILQAMKELSDVSCVVFRPLTRDDTSNIEFQNNPMTQGCSSYVGWQNRRNQPVQLSTVCSKGNAIHEVLHALGFFHEQTRNDRDEYVRINYQNIQPGFENNFKKDMDLYPNSETDYFNVSYNYDSIMHYGKTYFSKNQQPTIEVLETPTGENQPMGSSDNLGQRDFISEGDVEMLRRKYNCDAVEAGEDVSEDPTVGEGDIYTEEPEESPAITAKPTTKNPMCQLNPSMPMCKQ